MARTVKGLTNTQVERAKFTVGTQNELNDGLGLFLELYATGTKKWRFRYTHPQTKKRTKLTLGSYPSLSIAQAREKREEYRALLSQGIDPKVHIDKLAREQELADSNTFLAVAEKWKAKKQGEITDKTLAKYWRSLELHVFPFMGMYPISEIVPTLAILHAETSRRAKHP